MYMYSEYLRTHALYALYLLYMYIQRDRWILRVHFSRFELPKMSAQLYKTLFRLETRQLGPSKRCQHADFACWTSTLPIYHDILLMEESLHQLIGSVSEFPLFTGVIVAVINPKWCRISSINSIIGGGKESIWWESLLAVGLFHLLANWLVPQETGRPGGPEWYASLVSWFLALRTEKKVDWTNSPFSNAGALGSRETVVTEHGPCGQQVCLGIHSSCQLIQEKVEKKLHWNLGMEWMWLPVIPIQLIEAVSRNSWVFDWVISSCWSWEANEGTQQMIGF